MSLFALGLLICDCSSDCRFISRSTRDFSETVRSSPYCHIRLHINATDGLSQILEHPSGWYLGSVLGGLGRLCTEGVCRRARPRFHRMPHMPHMAQQIAIRTLSVKKTMAWLPMASANRMRLYSTGTLESRTTIPKTGPIVVEQTQQTTISSVGPKHTMVVEFLPYAKKS